MIFSVVFSVDAIFGTAQTEVIDSTSNGSDIAKWLALGSALAVGLATLGSGLAIKTTGTAAISILSERPEEFFKGFLVVALGEALGIYGLIVAILLWTKIPTFTI